MLAPISVSPPTRNFPTSLNVLATFDISTESHPASTCNGLLHPLFLTQQDEHFGGHPHQSNNPCRAMLLARKEWSAPHVRHIKQQAPNETSPRARALCFTLKEGVGIGRFWRGGQQDQHLRKETDKNKPTFFLRLIYPERT